MIAHAFWLSLPVVVAGVLHMVVVKMDLFAGLRVPLDGGRHFRGEPWFGPNKTWRGVVVMVLGSAGLGAVQGAVAGAWAERSGAAPLDYVHAGGGSRILGYAWVNAVLGAGYVLGELPNSFAKRRLGITPGRARTGVLGAPFFLLDQADSVIAALVLGALAFGYGWRLVVVGTVCLTLLHLALNAVLYLTRVRRNL